MINNRNVINNTNSSYNSLNSSVDNYKGLLNNPLVNRNINILVKSDSQDEIEEDLRDSNNEAIENDFK